MALMLIASPGQGSEGNAYKAPTLSQASMKRPMVRFFYRPVLRSPFVISCLPGVGGVGEQVARYLSRALGSSLFAELISPSLPDYVIVEEGICRLPKISFYAAEKTEPNLVIVLGDALPSHDDLAAYYELCEEVVRLAKELGAEAVVSVGGFLAPGRASKGVFVAFTSEELGEFFLRAGAHLMPPGRIVGPTGLISALAAEAGIKAACLLGEVAMPLEDKEAGREVLRVLMEALGLSSRPPS